MTERPTLIVLAAGMGNRFGGLKQIAPVNPRGDAILDYSVYDAVRAGFQRVVFVIRKDIEEAFRAAVGSRFAAHVEVAYAFQQLDALPSGFHPPPGRTRPWGTLQATLAGAESVAGSFAVINADDFYGAASYRVLARHLLQDSSRQALVGFPLRATLSDFGPVSRGVCQVDGQGLLTEIVERKKIVRAGTAAEYLDESSGPAALSGGETVSMNMWGFTPAVVPLLRNAFQRFLQEKGRELDSEGYLPEAMNGLVGTGAVQVEVLPTDSQWFGMTYREDAPNVAASIRRLTADGTYPDQLWP